MCTLVTFTEIRMVNPDVARVWIYADTVKVNVSQNFLSFALDSHHMQSDQMWIILHSPAILRLAQYLSPAYLRIGGTAADLVIFKKNEEKHYGSHSTLGDLNLDCLNESDEPVNNSSPSNLSSIVMTGKEWLAINAAAQAAGLTVLFDLDYFSFWSANSGWDSTNARELFNFSKENNISAVWQLGNEPNHYRRTWGKSVPPSQFGRDVLSLQRTLSHKFPDHSVLVGPDVTNPKPDRLNEKTTPFLRDFLRIAGRSLNAVTWHQYYFDGKTAQIEDFLELTHFNALKEEIKMIKDVTWKSGLKKLPIWITETSSAYGGGAPGLSDRFVASFLWLDKLGLAASQGVEVVVRQTLIGGHYGLIDPISLQPLPDWWISLLYKRLVGTKVLQLITIAPPGLRSYLHCAAGTSGEAVLYGINLERRDATIELSQIGAEVGLMSLEETLPLNIPTEIYILTAPHKNLTSKSILLNGRLLDLSPDGLLPRLDPVTRYVGRLLIPARSLFFVVLKVQVPVC